MTKPTEIISGKAPPGKLRIHGARLLVLKGPNRGKSVRIDREEIVVGTAQSAHLVLSDPTVSRSHFRISVEGDRFRLRDLESTNGVYVESRRVFDLVLEPGDTIDAGNTRLRLEAVGDAVDLELSTGERCGRLVGKSALMKRLFAQIEQIARENLTVDISGETGSGKDLVAQSIHELSPRKNGPFVVVDCGSIPGTLLEAELFGHERGAFTGAVQKRVGAFREADGGTLFLDEIGELPRELQPKLLRAIETRQVHALGGTGYVEVDVRIVAATNRDLRVEVNRGTFREDLYYRLSVIHLRVPALRERPEDIPLLAEHFRREFSNDPAGTFDDKVIQDLAAHSWPGNVRELRNHVERLVRVPETVYPLERPAPGPNVSFGEAKARAVAEFEHAFCTGLLGRAGGNISEAARLGQMDRVYLTKLLRRHGIR